jgi:transcriptional regulator with XRE-family HTH domain
MLAEELKARRAVEKLSQQDFAKMLGISQNYLSEIETGHKKVSKALEAKYSRLYPSPLINITWSRGADCPFCTGDGRRIWRDEKNPERDVYECADCDRVYRARESWCLTDEDWLRLSKQQRK